ncbi:unnamed protein product [Chrysodeixis includens]|uniref:Uncharacterized protein n=1 Tax=Chrysodeixis includens TaxID=689277 RepID=A0A9P0BT08_CHRIL|nr:unnamed protein product [Chrysodeixis includens]
MTKFLILFAIVAFASVNAQFNNNFPGNIFPGFPGFPNFPFPQLPLFPPLGPGAVANMKPIPGGHVSGSYVSTTSHNGKTETILGTNTNGKGEFYHIKS